MIAFLPALGAIGTAAGGIGTLVGAFRGGGSSGGGGGGTQMMPSPGYDLSPIYASLLTGDQTVMSAAGSELANFMGLYNQGEGIQNQIGYNQTMGQFNEAMNQQRMATGLRTGVASTLAGNAIGLGTEEARSKLAVQMLGAQNAQDAQKDRRLAKMASDQLSLQGQAQIQNTGVAARGQAAVAGVQGTMALRQAGLNNATSLRNTGLQQKGALMQKGVANQGMLLNQGLMQKGQTQRTGLEQAGQTQRAGLSEAGQTTRTGMQAASAANLAGLSNTNQLMMQGNQLQAQMRQQGLGGRIDITKEALAGEREAQMRAQAQKAQLQQTGMQTAAATTQAGIQAMSAQQQAAMANEQALLMQGLKGTQGLQMAQAQGDMQAGLAAQGTANTLAGAQGLSNVRIGEAQETLRNDLLRMRGANMGDMYKGTVGNIQGTQREQEMLRGTGALQTNMLVGQTDQQRTLQEDKYEGEQSLVAGQALANQKQLIGQTARDQAMLYGNLQAEKVRADIEQGRAVEMSRERFAQDFAKQDAAFKQQMAQKRFGARQAMAGQRAFA